MYGAAGRTLTPVSQGRAGQLSREQKKRLLAQMRAAEAKTPPDWATVNRIRAQLGFPTSAKDRQAQQKITAAVTSPVTGWFWRALTPSRDPKSLGVRIGTGLLHLFGQKTFEERVLGDSMYGLAVDSGPSAARAQEARLERAIRDAIRRKDFATAERLQRQLDIARRASQGRTVYPKAQGRTVYPTLPNALQSLVQRLKATFPPPASTLPAPGALTPSAATPMPTPEAVPAVPSEEATDIVDSSEGMMGYWNSLSTTTKVAVGAGALVGVYALFLRR